MSLKLSASDDQLSSAFLLLKDFRDVADLLEVKTSVLGYYLHRANNYKIFNLKKRSGGRRTIFSPVSPLKIIQRKLNQVLHAVYRGRSPAHGCVRGRSILTNASRHIDRDFLLNFDLKDFFPSIHFGRVQGLFEGKPYNLPSLASVTLAQICCHNGVLPAGAPTSPTIANMICAQLDSQLKTLARGVGCTYTRYVDDITISTRRGRFPPVIAYRDPTTKSWTIGDAVTHVITTNGFEIHPTKTRVLPRSYRQEVTGLIVTNSVNVKRRLIRQTRAMLNAWEHWGFNDAAREFQAKYDRKQRSKGKPDFARVVRGKIEFIGSIRGRDDAIYLDLISRYCFLDKKAKPPHVIAGPRAGHAALERAIWLLEEPAGDRQGTGFAADGHGILTAHHVVENGAEARQPWVGPRKYPTKMNRSNKHVDIAEIAVEAPLLLRLRLGASDGLKVGDRVKLFGLPKYRSGDGVNIKDLVITQKKMISGVPHYAVEPPIIFGSSGGPILNSKNEVVGIAVKGQGEPGEFTSRDEVSSFIPISTVRELASSEQRA
jgi:RNA-directed DNA polymerase